MIVTTESGRQLTIPAHHPIYTPIGNYRPGDRVDPSTVEVDVDRAGLLRRGVRLIIDNKVEVVREVAMA